MVQVVSDWRDILAIARANAQAERQARLDDGWEEVAGYPVVFEEEYVIGDYTYFANKSQAGMVWRRINEYTPAPVVLGGPDPLDPTITIPIGPGPIVSGP